MERAAGITVIEIKDRARMDQAYAIRRRVFIEEQHVPEEIELDADDARALHALALDGSIAVGCGRMLTRPDHAKIGRMAVLRERRGEGIGRLVLEFLMEAARQRGCRKAVLDAQLTAEGFYRRNGYVAKGEPFEEGGIMHRQMERAL
ncbi:MAG: GNAT family N-acetyltransferase [Candidatus Binataceae bacterium]